MNDAQRPNPQSREALLEVLRSVGRQAIVAKIASSIAHELGTPLNVIAGRAAMIAGGEVSGAELEASARAIVEQTNRMTSFIKDLLAEARRVRSRKTNVHVFELFARTITVAAPVADQSHVELFADPEAEDFVLHVDADRFLEALTNLVEKAIERSAKGGKVVLSSKKEGARYAIDVKDNGSTIEAEHLPHIFKPFFNITKDTQTSGLALSIALGIVRDYGGWIDVESEAGAGTRFKVWLPEGGVTCKPDAS